MNKLKLLLGLAAAALLASLAFLYSGLYNVGADDQHLRPVYWALETLRERSIAVRAGQIDVPALDDPQMLLAGGADYNDMCSGCHLKPGKASSDISSGLYPRPPNLAMSSSEHGHGDTGRGDAHGDLKASAARQFWIIKHGIKASGMAAFGPSHDDARIWAMVAFLQKLPSLDATQYQILTARENEGAGHEEHAEGSAAMPSHGSMPTAAASDSPIAAVEAFHAALKSGDVAAVKSWLAPDVLIFEGGGAERSLDEYAGHHLPADMAFLKDAQIDVLKTASGGDDATAWVNSESRIRGKSSKGRPLDVRSTETALLRREGDRWRIVHVHWSSQDFKTVP